MCEEQSLRKLFELSRQLVLSLDLNDILQATVEGVATLTGLDSAAVYLFKTKIYVFSILPLLYHQIFLMNCVWPRSKNILYVQSY